MVAERSERTAGFGEAARKHFYLEEETAFTNHGSYGCVPSIVMEERFRLLRLVESHPDRWFRVLLPKLYEKARLAVAEFVGSDNPDNLVFVTNATSAVNTVVKHLKLGPEDKILCTSHTYNACHKAVDSAMRRADADIITIDISLPIRSEKDIVDQMVETCRKNVGVRLAVIDHISCPSGLLFPVAEITRRLQQLGVLVLIDGAHAPGQLHLQLDQLGADFYTGNLHKWCFAPKGTAFLWVAPAHQASLEPLVTSTLYGGSLQDQFYMQGTMDHTPYLTAPLALQFYQEHGGREALLSYATPILDWAQQMLCHSLDTSVLPVPASMVSPFMRVIRLPRHHQFPVSKDGVEKLLIELTGGHCAAVNMFSGHLWLRISCNLYSTKQDFIKLRDGLVRMFRIRPQPQHSPDEIPADIIMEEANIMTQVAATLATSVSGSDKSSNDTDTCAKKQDRQAGQ